MKSPKRRSKKTSSRKNALEFTSLEPRNLLAGISFDAASGVVTVDGSEAADQVQMVQSETRVTVTFHGLETREFDLADVREAVFYGRHGDDWFRNSSSIPVRAYGQLGNDILLGGQGNDKLIGGGGNDRIEGREGNDFMTGDDGDDDLRGDDGDDVMLGGQGDDTMSGGGERDLLFGQQGADQLFGLSGDDFLSGGDGDDVLVGDQGRDDIRGGAGRDQIWGGDDDDHLRGGSDDDRLVGGLGNDLMHGEDGADHMQGNAGLDRMFGSYGDDLLFGGDDDDLMIGNEGRDSLIGGSGNDTLLGNDDADYLDGQEGHDHLHAGRGDDFLKGGSGRDKLFGQDGEDRLDGDDGNDDLSGGRGADHLSGGRGNDDYDSDSDDDVSEDADDSSESDDFEVRGTVTNLNTELKTFEVLGLPVDYSVAYLEGPLVEGAFVKVEGGFDGTRILAKEVEREQDDHRDNFEARGTVVDLDTTAQTFSFFGLTVDYSGAEVEGTLAEDATIELEGRYDGAGLVIAREISLTDSAGGDDSQDDSSQSDGDVEVRGLIQDLDTNAQTFTVLGIPVSYAGAEVQGTLANGAYFKVDGRFDGTLVAREVQAEQQDDRDENIRIRGPVADLDVQAQTFTLLGLTVDFSGAELEGSFQDGTSVEVDGWYADGLITAEEVEPAVS